VQSIRADRYATALIDVARNSGRMDALREEMAALTAMVHDDGTLCELLIRIDDVPGAGETIVRQLIEKLMPSQIVENLLMRLARKKQMGDLSAILHRFRDKILEADGITPVTITAVRTLGNDEKEQLTAQLNRLFPGEIHIEWIIDPSILGGLLIQSGDRIIDGSLKDQITLLRQHMTHLKKEPVT